MKSDVKQFRCAKLPAWGLLLLYALGVIYGLTGVAFVILGLFGLVAATVIHYSPEPHQLAGPASERNLALLGSLLALAAGTGFCLAARIAQWGTHAPNRISAKLESSQLHITDFWGRQRVVEFEDISQVRVVRRRWPPTTRTISVMTREGRSLRLPYRLERADALVREIVERTGLIHHDQGARWESWSRSEE